MRRISSLVVVLALAMLSPLEAQEAATAAAEPTPAAAPAPMPPPFDPAVAALPARYEGQDFPALFKALVVLPKGEFETTEEHAARRPRPQATIHAFTLEADAPTYDADAGVFRYRLATEGSLKGRPLTLTTTRGGELDTYTASNAFGATVEVIRSSSHEWGVMLPNQAHQIIRLAVPAPPARAAELKPRLRLLAVLRLRPDSVVEVSDPKRLHTDSQRTPPRLDYRYDFTVFRHDLPADLLALWAYDHDTGEVLGRFDLSGHRLEPDGRLAPQELAPAEHVWTIRDRVRRGMTADEVERLAAPMRPKVVKRPGKRQEWTYNSWLTVELVEGKVAAVKTTQGLDVTAGR